VTATAAHGGLFSLSGRQWLVLLMVQLSNMLFGMTVTLANLVLPQMRGTFSATQDEIAWVVTLNLVATAIATPMTGWLANRLGWRNTMFFTVLRQPSRLASHPVMGVAMAVATRFSVTTQAISSWVAEKVPRICGSTRLASVTVMPNSMLESCTINSTSHCRPLKLKRPP